MRDSLGSLARKMERGRGFAAALAGFVVAGVTGLLQAATGIHEPLVALVPRLVVMGAAVVLPAV